MTTVATRPAPSTAVAIAPPKLAVTLLEHRSQIEDLLPRGVSLSHVIAAVRLEALKTPKLADCTDVSLVQSVSRIVQWGLEIGVNAYLVPFWSDARKQFECTPIAGYRGLSSLMIASKAVRYVDAKVVYAGDVFTYRLGLNPVLDHEPVGLASKRGKITHAYCILRLPMGRDVFEVMSIEDIEAIRKQHSKLYHPDKVPECPDWYAMKTIIRKTSKLVPTDPRLTRYLRVVEEDEAIERAEPMDAITATAAPGGAPALTAPVQNPPAAVPPQATEEQITTILGLLDEPGITVELRNKVRAAMKKGMRAARADVVIGELQKLIPVNAGAAASDDDDLPF